MKAAPDNTGHHIGLIPPSVTTGTQTAPSQPVDGSSKRHGKAAAIAMWLEIERVSDPRTWDAKAVHASREIVERYLCAYAAASADAKRGFLLFLGEWLSLIQGSGIPNVERWSAPKRMRGSALTDAERDAHAAAWLQGDAR